MTPLKGVDIDRFASHPDPARPIALVYGPDAGLVRERVDAIVKASVDDHNDPFALARLDGDALSAEPSRLVEEAHTFPLFGGRRAVVVKAGAHNIMPAVEPLLATPPERDCRIVIEAGDLKKNAPLRVACEQAVGVAVLPCYVDNDRDLARLVDDEMRDASLTIASDARALLVSLLGGDRKASRSEIRKVALYAHGKGRVETEDVLAIGPDASVLALDAVIDAAFAGRVPEVEAQLSKAQVAGASGNAIAFAALRMVAQLHRARLSVDGGAPPKSTLRSFVPPIFFKREAAIEAILTAWTTPRLARAMSLLSDAARDARMRSDLSDVIAHRALLSIATAARRRD